MNQSDYWSSVADSRNFTTIFDEKVFRNYVSKNSKILDVGCGYGRTLNEMYNAGYKNLVGADTSIEMLNRGKREFPHIEFVQSSEILPFEDCFFDAVILFGVLCSVVNEDTQRNLINEIKRVLKPNGVIYVNDFLINDNILYKLRYKKNQNEFGIYGVFKLDDGGIIRHHTEDYIKELLFGFTLLEYKKLQFKTTGGNISNGFYFIGSKHL